MRVKTTAGYGRSLNGFVPPPRRAQRAPGTPTPKAPRKPAKAPQIKVIEAELEAAYAADEAVTQDVAILPPGAVKFDRHGAPLYPSGTGGFIRKGSVPGLSRSEQKELQEHLRFSITEIAAEALPVIQSLIDAAKGRKRGKEGKGRSVRDSDLIRAFEVAVKHALPAQYQVFLEAEDTLPHMAKVLARNLQDLPDADDRCERILTELGESLAAPI